MTGFTGKPTVCLIRLRSHSCGCGITREPVRAYLLRLRWNALSHSSVGTKSREDLVQSAFRFRGMAIDLGGIGKEYAVDRVFEQLVEAGVQDLMVNFGNDVRVGGRPPVGSVWRVGLEHPSDPGTCWGGVGVRNRAVATSGDYLRFFEHAGKRYGHIIDHRSGAPVDHGEGAISVVAPTCTQAGVFATSCFILGPHEGLSFLERQPQIEGVFHSNGKREETSRFFFHAI